MTTSTALRRVVVGTGPLTVADVVAVARGGAGAELSEEALRAVADGRELVDRLATDTRWHDGVSTGFCALATRCVPPELRTRLQAGLARSHAAGS